MACGMSIGAALSALTISAASLTAQTPTAEVTGVVQDTASRRLVDVEIKASNRDTGYAYRTSTSPTGRFWLRGLPPGNYDITARRIGLRSEAVRNAVLTIGRTAGINFTLRSSPVEVEPIVVRIAGALVESARSGVSYVIDREKIEQLPEESRQFMDLAQLVPGATAGTRGPLGTGGPSIGALNRQSLGVLVDGGNFKESLFGNLGGSVPLLAIQEFEVVQSQYSADLGRAASGIVNVVTRRGGNELGIEGIGLYRHHALNARGAFEAEKPEFDRSHWGAAVGGPLIPDRMHFFVALERRVHNDFATVNTDGTFSSFEGTFRTPFVDNLFFARIDHRPSAAHELTLRYAGEVGDRLVGVGGGRSFEYGRNNSLDMHSALLSHRWTPADGWLNEARVHFLSSRSSLDRNASAGPTLVFPSLRVGPHQGREALRSLHAELRNDLSWISTGGSSTHRLKLGAHLTWLKNEFEQVAFENGFFVFRSDTASSPALALLSLGDAIRLDARNLHLAFYIQDDWTPVPNLTLSPGLRYDVETNGSNQDFVSPFAADLSFIPMTPHAIDKNNLAPRFGVAWDPTGQGHTVVRGGFGIFHDALVAGPLLAFERSSGAKTAQVINPGTTDVHELEIDSDDVGPAVWTHGDIDTAMTRQFSLGIQHRFRADLEVRVDGLIVQGRNLLLQRDVNPIDSSGRRTFPGFSDIFQILSEGRADAKMLLVEIRKDLPMGWLDVGYTLADRKNTSDSWNALVPLTDSESLDLDLEWGPAAWDERHRLVATGGVELLDIDLVTKMIYASARAFTAITGSNDNGDFSSENDRPQGEGRNARRGPDFFRTDIGITWSRIEWRRARIAFKLNVYNLFNTRNGDPSSVQNNIQSPVFGQPLAALHGRQMEVGIQARWN